MSPLRQSLSIHRTRPKSKGASHSQDLMGKRRSLDDGNLTRSSIDTFVIPGRTRYPSSKVPKPQASDYRLTKSLLTYGGQEQAPGLSGLHHEDAMTRERSILSSSASANLLSINSMDGSSDNTFHGPFDTQSNSPVMSSNSTWTKVSLNPLRSASNTTSSRDTREFVDAYNLLAEQYHCSELMPIVDVDPFASQEHDLSEDHRKTPVAKNTSRGWFLGKLTKTSSSKNLKDKPIRPGHSISRKNSIGSLLGRGMKRAITSRSLDDFYRIGGVSILYLPSTFMPIQLAIPTSVAATGQYLIDNGRETAGIFRIPGQLSVINALYDYYMQPLRDISKNDQDHVEATVGTNSLPLNLISNGDVSPSVHDIASVFKKLLWDIPGGILGSLTLFKALRESQSRQLDGMPGARLAALALLSLQSPRRLALVSAIFGLLAFLKHESPIEKDISLRPWGSTGQESMSSHAFGVIFAPLLLGDLAERIDLREDSKISPIKETTSKRTIFSHKRALGSSTAAGPSSELESSKEKATVCAKIVEFLVLSWEDISRQMTSLICQSDGTQQILVSNLTKSSREDSRLGNRTNATSSLSLVAESPRSSSASSTEKQRMDNFDQLPLPPTPTLELGQILSKSAPAAEASLALTPTPITIGSMKPLAHSLTSLDLRGDVRWPSLQPAITGGYGEMTCQDLPWWERRARSSPTMPSRYKSPFVQRQKTFGGSKNRTGSRLLNDTNSAGVRFRVKGSELGDINDTRRRSRCKEDDGFRNGNDYSSPFQRDTPNDRDAERHEEAQRQRALTSSPPLPMVVLSKSSPVRAPMTRAFSSDSRLGERFSGRLSPRNDRIHVLKQISRSASKIPRHTHQWHQQMSPYQNRGTNQPAEPPTADSLTQFKLPVHNYPSEEWPPFKHRSYMQSRATNYQEPRRPQLKRIGTGRSNPADPDDWSLHPSSYIRSSRPHTDPSMEPPVARHLHFESSSSEYWQSRTPSNETSENASGIISQTRHLKVTMLYEKITQLQSELSARAEENIKLRRQLEAMSRSKTSGTLAEQLRHAEREAKMWKTRTQWAESVIQGRMMQPGSLSTGRL